MQHADARWRLSAADFLAWDEDEPLRHEFVRGEVRAMAGSDDRHAAVAGNLAIALRAHLRGTPCRTFAIDVKLRVDAADCFFYPDVMVTCDAVDAADRRVKRAPVLVAEVLSPATAAYDHGGKFADYRRLPSLREYLLVDPRTRRCDLYRLGSEGLWVLHPTEPGQALVLASVELEITAEALWDEVPPPDNLSPDARGRPV